MERSAVAAPRKRSGEAAGIDLSSVPAATDTNGHGPDADADTSTSDGRSSASPGSEISPCGGTRTRAIVDDRSGEANVEGTSRLTR